MKQLCKEHDLTLWAERELSSKVSTLRRGSLLLTRVQVDPVPDAGKEEMLELRWDRPLIDIQYEWHPLGGYNRALRVNWYQPLYPMLASSAPVICFFSESGENRLTIALSDAQHRTGMSAGVREEDGQLCCVIHLPLAVAVQGVTLYRDTAPVRFEDAIRAVSVWWEQDCGITPAAVPDAARLPMYSAWYSFHQQVFAQDIEEECALAKEMGMDTVIVDDGWQTADNNRGYAYCGDWQPAPEKIPDMAAHVERVHALGMKYLLWYSVPFVGIHSAHWDAFKDKMLNYNEQLETGTVDPRYPDVRAYLIETYRKALADWKLDGFKLDFVDSFQMGNRAVKEAPGMDIPDLMNAVDRLMLDVLSALRAVKPDILIEFRQGYIGPNMRKYGNMFRVGDCPDNRIANRVGIVDLRLLSGNTAVHSDMLMWHREDTAESAAAQIQNIVFGVAQISVKLEEQSPKHLKMLRFWLDFMKENRSLLLDAPLYADAPQLLYPVIRTGKDGRTIIGAYDPERVVTVPAENADKVMLLNATPRTEKVLRFEEPRAYHAELRDCTGEPTGTLELEASRFVTLDIPESGMLVLTAE